MPLLNKNTDFRLHNILQIHFQITEISRAFVVSKREKRGIFQYSFNFLIYSPPSERTKMSLNIIEVAKQLCASIASKAESEAEGIMDDKILMLKLICCTRCPREDDK